MYTKDKKFISGMFDEISPAYDKLNHLFSANQDKRWRKTAVRKLQQSGIDLEKHAPFFGSKAQ